MGAVRRIRLFVDAERDSVETRLSPNVLTRAITQWGDDPTLHTTVELVDRIEGADAAFLPSQWRTYRERDRRLEVPNRMARAAQDAGIPLLIFNLDDLEPRLPFRNAVLFHPGPTRSFRRRHPLTFAIPSFTREHVEEFGEAGPYPLPNALDVPTVGFCGLARNPSPRAYASMTVRNVRLHAYHGLTPAGRVLRYKARGNSPLFRGAILRRLAASPLLKTRFLYRDGTMSFAASDEARTRMRREFVDNMLNSEYAVCIRGNGNFSIRFYEALAAGRIPLHISTDDVLPYDFSVDWTKHIISVAADDIDSAPQLVFDHHFVSSHEDRVNRAKKNNELWRARMTSRGFLDHFHEFIDEITKTAR